MLLTNNEFLQMMDAEMRTVLAIQQQHSKDVFVTDKSVETLRQNYEDERAYWNQNSDEMHFIYDMKYQGPYGPIHIRTYQPNNILSPPLLLYFHGGGFVVGSCNTHDKIMRTLAKQSGAIVIGIDYHLAPEYHFPTQIEECSAFIKQLLNAEIPFSVPTGGNIFLGGDSAGAHLAMAVYLHLRKQEIECKRIKGLLLYYGYYGLYDSISRRLYGSEWDGMRKEDLDYYESAYLGKEYEKKEQEESYNFFLHSLPPNFPNVFLGACELDPLLDDSKLLYELLKDKTTCELAVFPGTLHGFLHYSEAMHQARQALQMGADFLKRHASR